jgi:N-acetylmuramoyl-L-alanine amidase
MEKRIGFWTSLKGFSLWVSQKNNKYEESLGFAKTLADQLMASGLKFTTHHDELTNTAEYGRLAPLVDRQRGIYDAADHIAVLYESHMPAVLFEAGMLVNRAEEQVLSSASHRATVAKAVAIAVEKFLCRAGATNLMTSPIVFFGPRDALAGANGRKNVRR